MTIFTTNLDPVYQAVFNMFTDSIYSFSGGVITNNNTDADYDFTGHTCVATVREKEALGTILMELDTADGTIVLEDGQIKVPDFTIDTAGDYVADFVVTLPDNQELVFLAARFIVKQRT